MLKRILKTKQEEVSALYSRRSEIEAAARDVSIPRYNFVEALRSPRRSSALIAEVKKASPSKGVLRTDFEPVEIAQAYQQAGADALSVLTDVTYFQGSGAYIAAIKERVTLPILRKDFIIDPLQITESLVLGADAILLIAKALPIERLVSLYRKAEEVGLDCLIEVANEDELEALLSHLTPPVIGINNRDLTTFETSLEQTKKLLPLIPPEVVVISESGISSAEAVSELTALGAGGFLIGEYLMRQENLVQAVEKLYATP